MNSVRREITEGSVASEIRLSLSNPNTKVHVLVEGQDDIKFFKRSISNSIPISEAPGGKESLIEIFGALSDSRLIAICDKDYDTNDPGLILYDYCSLETMLFSVKDVLNDLCDSLGVTYEERQLYEIFQVCSFIGTIRQANASKNGSINFQALNPVHYFVPGDFERTKHEVISILNRTSQDDKVVEEELLPVPFDVSDMLDIIQGHDLIHLFQRYFGIEVKCQDIQARLILSSTSALIKDTHFYQRICTVLPKEQMRALY